jgi:hypothetical protein
MLKEEEIAWIVREFASGRMQSAIGKDFGYSAAGICQQIKKFCDRWSGHDVYALQAYGDERRRFARIALNRYREKHARITRPSLSPRIIIRDLAYTHALNEHVWLLRVEGVSFREIGERLGMSQARVRQRMIEFSKRMNKAVRRTHIKIYPGNAPVRDWLMVNSENKRWI